MSQVENVNFTVADMTCGHCASTIRSALEKALPGASIEIDVATKRVSVVGDELTAETAIREAGYTPQAA